MWWNDTYMPEYLFNNHEAYVGNTFPEILAEFAKTMGYVVAAAGFMAFMMYYYNMGYLKNFTLTKVAHRDYFDNAQRMKKEKVGLEKDFMGSCKPITLMPSI